jgi:YidC/Oxa1 family membrane protein insertase
VIGYISDNLLLPILDFFYGLVPSYGLAIIALTVVIRLALFPLSAGSRPNTPTIPRSSRRSWGR